MADSRFAAYRHFFQDRWPLGLKASLFVFIALGSFFLSQWLAGDDWAEETRYALLLLLLAIGLWLTEAIPPFATALLVIGIGVLALGSPILSSHPIAYTHFTETLSSSVIWLLLGGFFLAQGMQKAGLDLQVFRFTMRLFGTEPKRALLGLMLTTWLASSILSNTASTAMMLAAILPLMRKLGARAPMTKASMLGIPAAATLGGMATIIGSPPNAVAVGFLEKQDILVSFPQWVGYGLVPSLLLTLISWWILTKKYPPQVDRVNANIPDKDQPLSAPKQATVIIALFLTLILWFTTPLHGIAVTATAFVPIVLLTVSGVITADDFNGMPWDTLILVAGGLSLGVAMTETGLVMRMADGLQHLPIQGPWFILLLAYVTVLLSNIMSNTAASTVLLPIALEALPGMELETAVTVGLSASCALLLPVSTPPNAIAYSYGYLEQKDFRMLGSVLGLLAPPLILAWVVFFKALESWTL